MYETYEGSNPSYLTPAKQIPCREYYKQLAAALYLHLLFLQLLIFHRVLK